MARTNEVFSPFILAVIGFASALMHNSVCFGKHVVFFSEKKRYAPKRGQTNQSIDYSGDQCRLTAEEPCYYIKTEYTEASPVYTADNE